jgi:hypothetical protein
LLAAVFGTEAADITGKWVADDAGLLPGAPALNSSAVLARPKSRILTTPAGVICRRCLA